MCPIPMLQLVLRPVALVLIPFSFSPAAGKRGPEFVASDPGLEAAAFPPCGPFGGSRRGLQRLAHRHPGLGAPGVLLCVHI